MKLDIFDFQAIALAMFRQSTTKGRDTFDKFVRDLKKEIFHVTFQLALSASLIAGYFPPLHQ